MSRLLTVSYGAVATTKIVAKRGVPPNAAETNRILRLASATYAEGTQAFVVTPAITPRIKSSYGMLEAIADWKPGIHIVAIRQLGIRFVGYFLRPFTAVLAARRIARKRKIVRVVQYNHFLDACFFSLWCKIRYGAEILYDLEDVCIPTWRDWLPGSRVKPLRELIGWGLMHLSAHIANRVIVPSQRFVQFLPSYADYVVVSGCQPVLVDEGDIARNPDDRINVLYGGAIRAENGIDLLMDALALLDEKPAAHRFLFHISGFGPIQGVRERVERLKNIKVRVWGSLSHEDFRALYGKIDVCLVLQDVHGRFQLAKTPSKGYEALCSGKTIVVSNVGDFPKLPDSVCWHLEGFEARSLLNVFEDMRSDEVTAKRLAALRYAKIHFDSQVIHKKLNERSNV